MYNHMSQGLYIPSSYYSSHQHKFNNQYHPNTPRSYIHHYHLNLNVTRTPDNRMHLVLNRCCKLDGKDHYRQSNLPHHNICHIHKYYTHQNELLEYNSLNAHYLVHDMRIIYDGIHHCIVSNLSPRILFYIRMYHQLFYRHYLLNLYNLMPRHPNNHRCKLDDMVYR